MPPINAEQEENPARRPKTKKAGSADWALTLIKATSPDLFKAKKPKGYPWSKNCRSRKPNSCFF